jgi:hypothetical protein
MAYLTIFLFWREDLFIKQKTSLCGVDLGHWYELKLGSRYSMGFCDREVPTTTKVNLWRRGVTEKSGPPSEFYFLSLCLGGLLNHVEHDSRSTLRA